MDRSDIDAIKILATAWAEAGRQEYYPGTRMLKSSAVTARKHLDHAIRYLRNGFVHHKNRVYRTNRVGNPGENLWNM